LKLDDLGITYDESSKWQKLAAIPEEEFEGTVERPGSVPTTEGVIQHRFSPPAYVPTRDGDALRLLLLDRLREPEQMVQRCPQGMRAEVMALDVRRIAPSLVK
jgi:hypothetical protein